MIKNNTDVLILSPHTDDAELGCGGTIIKMLETGKKIHWVVFSTAAESLPDGLPKNTLRDEFLNVVKELGVKKQNVEVFDFKVRYLFEERQVILEKLVEIRKKMNPKLVIGPSLNDLHQDHIVVANEMVRAFKSYASIISYELPWNHVTFNTQFFSKITKEHVKRKVHLLNNYKSQIKKNRVYFSKEYIFGIAKTRGTQIGAEYAEAFEVIRWIIL